MDSQTYISTEQHSGQCGHCRSQVHSEATTCSGCGAFWGFENGMNRDELYQASKDDIRFGLWYVAIMTSFVILGWAGFPGMLVLFLIGLLFSIKFLVEHLIMGFVNKRTARKQGDGSIDWWFKE